MSQFYSTLVASPSKVVGWVTAAAGLASAFWPQWFEQKVGQKMTTETIQQIGVGLLALSVLYFFLLWWLKPSDVRTESASTNFFQAPSQQISGGEVKIIYNTYDHSPNLQENTGDVSHDGNGFTVYLVLELFSEQANKTRTILASSDENGAGFEFKINKSNRATFTVTDSKGEPYSVHAPSGRKGVPMSQVVLVTLIAIIRENGTTLKILTNRDIVARQDFGFRITTREAEMFLKGMTVGGSKDKANHTKMNLFAVAQFPEVLSPDDNEKFVTELNEKCYPFLND